MKEKYEKLIGYVIDTNQFTSDKIKDVADAENAVTKLKQICGEDMPKNCFISSFCKMFSSYIKPNKLSLYDFLNEE
jgi:hypothetical protein